MLSSHRTKGTEEGEDAFKAKEWILILLPADRSLRVMEGKRSHYNLEVIRCMGGSTNKALG